MEFLIEKKLNKHFIKKMFNSLLYDESYEIKKLIPYFSNDDFDDHFFELLLKKISKR